jgi:AraC-like DNA-binding protein
VSKPTHLKPADLPKAQLVPVQSFADGLIGPRFGIRSQKMAAGNRRLHRHDYFEILFFASSGPQQRIYLRDYLSARGSIFFVSPMTPHQTRFGPNDVCYIIYFDLAFLQKELSQVTGISTQILAQAPELAPFLFQQDIDFVLSDSQVEVIQQLCERMLKEQSESRLCWQTVARAQLMMLLSEVCQSYESEIRALMARRSPMGSGERHVERAVAFIESHLATKLTLSNAANAAAVSPNYLATLLRRETGQTFVDLVTSRRMDRACELLSYTRLRISQIGDSVGYFDVDYFCRRFKQIIGCTPMQYRTAHRLVPINE